MKSTFLLLACLLLGNLAPAFAQRTIKISESAGYDLNDGTSAIQRAFDDPTVATIVFDDDRGSTITSGPVTLSRNDVTLRFEAGVTLKGKAAVFDTFQSLLTINAAQRVTIEGNTAAIEMNKLEYSRESQFRHCLALTGANTVTVQSLTLRGAPGDGLYIGPNYVNGVPDQPCRNLTVRSVIMDGNNRQGCSITDAIGVVMENCDFKNTAGTLPEAGLDMEPFRTNQHLQDILVTNSRFSGNAGAGVLLALVDMSSSSPPISVVVEDCSVTQSMLRTESVGAAVWVEGSTRPPGTFIMRRSRIFNERRAGILVRQYSGALAVAFEDVTMDNVVNEPQNSGYGAVNVFPIVFDSRTDPSYGNARFSNVRIIESKDRLHVAVPDNGSGPRAENVTGSICVESALPLKVSLPTNPLPSTTLAVAKCPTAPPGTTVRVRARTAYGANGGECAVAGMSTANYTAATAATVQEKRFTTTGEWATYTLKLDGTFPANQLRAWFTNNRDDTTPNRDLDIDWLEVNGVQYKSESQDTYSTGTFAAADQCAPGFKASSRLHCGGYFHYATRGGNIVPLSETSRAVAPLRSAITAHPNPVHAGEVLRVDGLSSKSGGRYKAQIVDLSGRVLQTASFTEPQAGLTIAQLTAGVYLLHLTNAGETTTQRLLVR